MTYASGILPQQPQIETLEVKFDCYEGDLKILSVYEECNILKAQFNQIVANFTINTTGIVFNVSGLLSDPNYITKREELRRKLDGLIILKYIDKQCPKNLDLKKVRGELKRRIKPRVSLWLDGKEKECGLFMLNRDNAQFATAIQIYQSCKQNQDFLKKEEKPKQSDLEETKGEIVNP